MDRDPVWDGIVRHLGLVHLEKREKFRIGRPEVVAAHVEFFFVDPIHFTIEDGLVGRSCHDRGGCSRLTQMQHGEAVTAHEGDGFAVGRENLGSSPEPSPVKPI